MPGRGVTVHGEWAIHSCPWQKQQGEEGCAHRLSLQGWASWLGIKLSHGKFAKQLVARC